MKNNSLVFLALVGMLAIAPACGDDAEPDPDQAQLTFVTPPPTTLTTGVAVDVVWEVQTDGDLHHTEIRACMGHSTNCGLGDMTSFDENFVATSNTGAMYTTSVTIDSAGPWTIAVFAHVGETPHISDVVHATVAD